MVRRKSALYPVVEKSFNPTWVGAPQFCIYISRRPTVGRHLTCLCMESKAICMESEAIYIQCQPPSQLWFLYMVQISK